MIKVTDSSYKSLQNSWAGSQNSCPWPSTNSGPGQVEVSVISGGVRHV